MPPRRRPKPFQSVRGETDLPVFARASILGNGMIENKPNSKAELTEALGFMPPHNATDNLYALNGLQLKRDRPLEGHQLKYPLEWIYQNYLPKEVRERIFLGQNPGEPEVFGSDDEHFAQVSVDFYQDNDSFWEDLTGAEYCLWPIEAEDSKWVTAIMHLTEGTIDDPDFEEDPEDPGRVPPRVAAGYNNVVEHWSVVDPERSPEARARVARVRDRIERIFDLRGIYFRADSYRQSGSDDDDPDERLPLPWVPPQTDGWSSGLRCFVLIRQMFQRITDFFCKDVGYDETFWDATSGWLDADQARHEMMGICAIACMDDMNWQARIAVEMIGTIQGVRELPVFETSSFRPSDEGKEAYVPESDFGGNNPVVSNTT
ncbi:hypothetical protein F4778DRAFT_381318 [Xylariomycetidae sp. FL2044]|nr:hypothetical protein F4778DRAFT_381318 [Xylariomycetidae sp. FL2044]